MLLMFAGYDVATAENGASALLHLNRVLPDLIVTDLNMPHMSGVELISHVRSSHPSVSIVAMSGDYQGDAVPASLLADRFYPKGQNLEHLLATIASLLATSTARGSAQTHPHVVWHWIRSGKEENMLGTILIVLLVLFLVGALPTWNHSRSWGYFPSGGLGLLLVIVVILLLLGRI